MRLYGQGLGDCFLLAFPRKGDTNNENPCYLVIDCGVAMSTPEKDVRIKKVVEDIDAATGGHIDVLAITHQHFDHISGFQDAWQEWKKITVDALYLPWTESTAPTGEHKTTKSFREVLEEASRKRRWRRRRRRTSRRIRVSRPRRTSSAYPSASAGAARSSARPTWTPRWISSATSALPKTSAISSPATSSTCPGRTVTAMSSALRCRARRMRKGRKYIELLADEKEMYSYGPLGLKVDKGKPGGNNSFAMSDDRSMPALASALLAAGTLDRDGDEGFSPFAPDIRLDWDSAMASPFFEEHYGESSPRGEGGSWRRVDSDWLAGLANLALRAGDYTNNVSLVLAFNLPGSDKMMLFPGDAQVGHWLSWHKIEKWHYRDASIPAKPPEANGEQTLMQNLLSRVAFYKVGHHGSHNATVSDKGLEAMNHKDLVAFVPVSVPVAQDMMGYCPMPFYPVLRALQRKTNGRVFLPNGKALTPPLLDDPQHAALLAASGIRCAAEKLPAKKKDGKVVEGEVPLYLEVTIA